MNKTKLIRISAWVMALFAFGLIVPFSAHAEEAENAEQAEQTEQTEQQKGGTSISLMPVSKVLQISPSSEYEDQIKITNDGSDKIEVEVYAAPYGYVYSEEEDVYRLGFNNETNFTQITRWITFDDGQGNWGKKVKYSIPANESIDVKYKISTPGDIPAGGQYAVIFAHTLTGVVSASGIKTEASPGMVIYGRSTSGETKIAAEISDPKINLGANKAGTKQGIFSGSAKVKNTGNVDFNAVGKLKIDPIIGSGNYETPSNKGRVSVIPESELEVYDEWEESPGFGIFKVSWTVTAGEETETIETVIFVNPIPFIIITIIVLTIITMWIIIMLRKRKERRSRLAV